MAKSAMIRARTEQSLKQDVEKILHTLGLSCSEAINLFFHQVKIHHGMPFDVKVPNKTTLKAMREVERKRGGTRTKNVEDMFKQMGI